MKQFRPEVAVILAVAAFGITLVTLSDPRTAEAGIGLPGAYADRGHSDFPRPSTSQAAGTEGRTPATTTLAATSKPTDTLTPLADPAQERQVVCAYYGRIRAT